ncbi:tetratricopeptide repeat-containing glycosyltransferase family protein [Microbacteriaceae bacterium K1510]|nr:tetratricopeptide repeat-containing glycosyltransferase family protein [Microbacteriaceae bacterium K1510]
MVEKARAAHGEGAWARAEKQYKAILERQPRHVEALHLLGLLNYQTGRSAQALRYMTEALKGNARSVDLLSDHGLALHALGRTEEALVSFDAALAIAPADPDLLNKRGVACLHLGRLQEALEVFDQALAREPTHIDALGNRGNTMLKLNAPEEAIASYDAAIRINGATARLLTNRAHALKRLDRLEEALADLRQALSIDPNHAEAAFELGMVQLTLGDFENGWASYERRWETGAFAEHRRKFSSPLWTGRQPLSGRTILLHAEQGFGDTIQFVRYAPLVAERGAKVVLEVQPELVRLMARVPGVDHVLARGDKLVSFDFHCPLMSLPLAFQTTASTVPASIPYINVDVADVAKWTGRLPAGKPRVGFCWAGKASHRNDINRSIPLARLARLLDNPEIDFVNLRVGSSDDERTLLGGCSNVFDYSALLADFVDTAGLIKQLDLVVSVDTSVTHLAGVLGVPTIVLLPFAADFRWLRAGDESAWYPGMRLFRQPRLKDWDSVIDAACDHLAARFEGALAKRAS